MCLEHNFWKYNASHDEQFQENITLNTEIENIQTELYDLKAKGVQIRSNEKWIELGEKNNSYFLGLEKQRQAKLCFEEI
jgi:hypothetical protein